jgi:hypothetical protein
MGPRLCLEAAQEPDLRRSGLSVFNFAILHTKASIGAKAVGLGRYYLYPLAAAGQAGVERALGLMQTEIERDMKLMGCTAIGQLSRDNLRFK